MKRVLMVLLSVSILLSTGFTSLAEEQVTLDLFSFGVEYADQYQQLAEIYMQSHPNVKVNVEIGTDEILRTKMASGEYPEIFACEGPQEILDWQDYLEDLSDQPWVEHVLPGMLDGATIDGKVYGVPNTILGYGYVYNKRIFEAAGIDAAELDTFDKIEAAFALLKEKIDSGERREQFPLLEAVMETSGAEYWIYGKHTANMALALELGSSLDAVQAESIEFTYSDALKELTDQQIRYTTNAETPYALTAVDYSMQIGGGFAIERVAVIQQGNWIYLEVKGIDPEVAENMGFLPLPMKGVKEDSICCGVGAYDVVNKMSSEAEKAAAKDWLNWLYQTEEGQNLCLDIMSMNPPFDNFVDKTGRLDVLMESANEYLAEGKTVDTAFTGFPTGFPEKMNELFQAYCSDLISWDEVKAQAIEAWSALR